MLFHHRYTAMLTKKIKRETSFESPQALTFLVSHACLGRFLSVSDVVSSIPGTVSSKTEVEWREKESQKRHLCSYLAAPGEQSLTEQTVTTVMGAELSQQ